MLKSGPNSLKQGPNALKTIRNRVSFGLNGADFRRNHTPDNHMQKLPPPEIEYPFAGKELRSKTSADNCKNIQNVNSHKELRQPIRKGKIGVGMHEV